MHDHAAYIYTQVQVAVATTLPVVLGGSDGGEELVPGM